MILNRKWIRQMKLGELDMDTLGRHFRSPYISNSMEQVFEKLIVAQLITLPSSQEPDTEPYLESDACSPHHLTLFP
jgi:hypothetical protein